MPSTHLHQDQPKPIRQGSPSVERVAVAMSGGVDSSVAAALLVEQGLEVVGVHLRLASLASPDKGNPRACCAAADVADVRGVAAKLGVDHYVLNYQRKFEQEVIVPFVQEYAKGRTPNPCLSCNAKIKFGPLLDQMRALGLTHLATGHYARIRRNGEGHYELLRALDRTKDQSYFLYTLNQQTLAHLRFPLGDLQKETVRKLAARRGLSTADKPDSQEICFVDSEGYAKLVEDRTLVKGPGELVTLGGTRLGTHRGLHHYTVGQRKGLGLGGGQRRYVLDLDLKRNRVVVGSLEEAGRSLLELSQLQWVQGVAPEAGRAVTVRLRHRDQDRPAHILAVGGRYTVMALETPAVGAAPGQAAVLYDGEQVLGGGILEASR